MIRLARVCSVLVGVAGVAACVGDDPLGTVTAPAVTPDAATDDARAQDSSSSQDGTSGDGPSDANTGCLQPAPDMISWWTGDSTFADKLGVNTFTKAGAGNVVYAQGEVGKGIAFDKTDFLQTNANGLTGLLQFTVEGWISIPTATTSGPILGRTFGGLGDADDAGPGAGWYFAIANGFPVFGIDGVVATSSVGAAADTLTHVAATYDGAIIHVYVNGKADGAASKSGALPSVGAKLAMGRLEALGDFNGVIDELAIYGRALTQAEIMSVVSAGAPGRCK